MLVLLLLFFFEAGLGLPGACICRMRCACHEILKDLGKHPCPKAAKLCEINTDYVRDRDKATVGRLPKKKIMGRDALMDAMCNYMHGNGKSEIRAG